MNAKKILVSAVALLFIMNAALGSVMPVDAWIAKYNEFAGKMKAELLDPDMITDRDDYGFYEFTMSDNSYLTLYLNDNVSPEGFFFETFADDESAGCVFACALAASDANISVDSANEVFDKASNAYEKGDDGAYSYFEYENWILVFSKSNDDKQPKLFSAFTLDAYARMLGESITGEDSEGPNESVPPDDSPDDKDQQPDDKGDGASEKDEVPEEEDIIHKL